MQYSKTLEGVLPGANQMRSRRVVMDDERGPEAELGGPTTSV
jgi:hypothetical protein